MLLGISTDEANGASTESTDAQPRSQSPARAQSVRVENHQAQPRLGDEGAHEPMKVEQPPPRKNKSPPVVIK